MSRHEPNAAVDSKERRSILFLRVHPLLALFEAWFLGGFLLAGLLSLHARLVPNVLTQGVFFLSGGAALWCAVRASMPQHQKRLYRWGQELLTALALSLLLVVGWGGVARLVWSDLLPETLGSFSRAYLFLSASGAEFLVFRLGVHLWRFWTGLRRRRLLWSWTHMQVQVVLAFTLVYFVLLVIVLFFEGTLPSRITEGAGIGSVVTSLVLTILPLLSVALAAMLFVLGVVLPPTVLFAYLLSRRTTRRLEALADAATKLRRGDYQTRVEVRGEDEIAQLQADFNAMAADLGQAMHDLQLERDKVARLLQGQRELVASVSHELRTPMATIRGYLESSRMGWSGQVPKALRHDLEVIESEIVRLQGLIDDLFTLSRAEAGGLTLDIQPTDVRSVIQHQVEAMAPLAWHSSRVEVAAEVPADLPLALADDARLAQVLVNLLRNSVGHTLPGGIVVVMAGANEEAIRIEVRDTGEGIDPEDLPRIWERFYQGKSTDRTERSGAGLGLTLVKELTEAMGGSVEVESVIGQGSCFTVRLPRA